MRRFYWALLFSLLMHILLLQSIGTIPKINMPETSVVVLTIYTDDQTSYNLTQVADKKSVPKQEQIHDSKISPPHSTQKITQNPTAKILNTHKKTVPVQIQSTKIKQQHAEQKPIESLAELSSNNHQTNTNQNQTGNSNSLENNSSEDTHGTKIASGKNGNITAPKAIHTPEPHYPSQAEKLHQYGTVQATIQIDVKGTVTSVAVSHSSGFGLLDNAAKRSLKAWRFTVATQDGIAIPAATVVNIHFTEDGVRKVFKH